MNPEDRIGCKEEGAVEVKTHKWFKGVDWELVLHRKIPPPWVPSTSDAEDT